MEPIKEKTGDAYRHDLQELYEEGSSKQWVFDEELFNFSNGILNEPACVPKLYRYSPADYWNTRNLETGQLCLTPISKLNDAMEGLATLNQPAAELPPDFGFVKCFSESGTDPLMWGRYADNAKGMCVKYDVTRLTKDESKILRFLFPVVYTNKRYSHGDPRRIRKELKRYYRDVENGDCITAEEYFFLQDILPLLLVKGKSWEYEKEWRIAIDVLSKEKYCNELYENKALEQLSDIWGDNLVGFDCVSAVYLGVRMPISVKIHIEDIVQRKNGEKEPNAIQLFEMKFKPDTFELEPIPVEPGEIRKRRKES